MIRGAFIGIDKYRDPLIGDLTGAARDAKALWAVLSDSLPELQAPLIADDAADLASVRAALDATLGAAEADDVVLLTFAGHGTPDHRLVLADSDASDMPGTTLSMDELAERFRTSRARAVLLLLDCCFSGGAAARVVDLGLVPRGLGIPLADVVGEGRILFAASSPTEPALEDPRTRHGLFTKAILDHLLGSQAPVSVMGMVADVVHAVRADAARLGYTQTPTMFGQVNGDLSLPAGQRGENYRSAFPEIAPIQIAGDFAELAAFGLPQAAIDAWQARYPNLNRLQVSAINDHNILGGGSLLTVAPTSAGKTFIGEMAGIKAIAEGRKAVFLLPYRALVNEKFEDFSAIYGDQLDLRIVRCSGDWGDQVGDVLRGKYDLAFFTYEKFLGMLLAAPHILNQIGLVVLDEAQFVTELGRGMTVELLLTYIVSARSRGISPQLIALSAVIGDVNSFDRWLDIGVLATTDRPVPLTTGVMDRTGAWSFSAPNGAIGRAQLVDCASIRQRGQKPSSQDVIAPLVQHLVSYGEKIIVFRNRRGPASGCANYLAGELGFPPALEVLDSLPEGDLSAMSSSLRQALRGGVAFHNSDLTREERLAVERGFRRTDGGIEVLVATSTVAAGINTPASTVIIVETEFPTKNGPQPYTIAQFKNMAGRAGRLGFENEGKAIALADSAFEANRLLRHYVQGTPEALCSSFDERNPGTWIIRLLAQVREVERPTAVDLVANTYGGYLAIRRDPRWRDSMAANLERLLDRMVADGLLEEENGWLRLTHLGRACGESPLELESAMRLVEIIRRVPNDAANPEQLLALIEALTERDDDYTPQGNRGEPQWQQAAARQFGQEVVRALRTRAPSDIAFYARCKRALILAEWINGVATGEIEQRYTTNRYFALVGHGDIRGFADTGRYLLEPAMRIAAIVLEAAHDDEAATTLLRRLEVGVPANLLPLSAMGVDLTRGEILGLAQAGIATPEAVAALPLPRLEAMLGAKARRLHDSLAHLRGSGDLAEAS